MTVSKIESAGILLQFVEGDEGERWARGREGWDQNTYGELWNVIGQI